MSTQFHRYSGYILLGCSIILVAQALFSDQILEKALGGLFLLSAAVNYFTAVKEVAVVPTTTGT